MAEAQLGFAETLVRVSHLVQTVYSDVSRTFGLTPQQTRLLCVLAHSPVGMKELGRLLHVEKSSVTGLVDRLEQHGLIQRVQDPGDRRACTVSVTAAGADLAARCHNAIGARLDGLGERLDTVERDRTSATLNSLLTVDAAPQRMRSRSSTEAST